MSGTAASERVAVVLGAADDAIARAERDDGFGDAGNEGDDALGRGGSCTVCPASSVSVIARAGGRAIRAARAGGDHQQQDGKQNTHSFRLLERRGATPAFASRAET